MSRTAFAALVLAGILLRAIALPAPGTGDLTVWKIWSYNAARHGVGTMYGTGGTPPERRVLEYAGAAATVDYPPLALYELGAAGDAYWVWSHRHFPNAAPLNAFMKLPAIAAEAGIALLLFALVRATTGVAAARVAALAYWLNPAALLDASILGYLDAQYVLPGMAAIAAATFGWPALAGVLITASILTKAQGVFMAPAVALAIWTIGPADRRMTRLLAAGAGALVTGSLIVAPIVVAGGWPNMVQALGRLATHDMLSANAANFWWIVGYALRAWYAIRDMGVWAAVTAPARILGIRRVIEIGYPDPRRIGIVLTVAATAWAIWQGARASFAAPRAPHDAGRTSPDLWLAAGVAAFTVHAYATLSAQVHENHLFAAVPLLILASAGRRGFRPIAIGISAVVALNLNLFYGFGAGIGWALPRAITVIDATVFLALFNCFLLSWHAVILRRQCSTAAARLPASAPA